MTAKKALHTTFRWIGRFLLAGLILAAGLIIFLLVRESITRRNYHAEYPPPGERVDLGTHSIHLNCTGSGSPTVLFESDLDQYGVLSWALVQPAIAEFTRACSYDRAGILWSDPGPLPRDGETIARELEAVLNVAGEEGPYVLVGHAFGGAYARIFTGLYRDQVCGMVLLESSHPEMLDRFEALGVKPDIPDQGIRPLISLLSHLGSPGRYKGNPYNLPPEIYNPMEAYLPESSMAWFDESVESPQTLAQAGMFTDFGDLPLIVMADSQAPSSLGAQGEAIQSLWNDLQQELLLLSDDSELRVGKIGHYPQIQNPEQVIMAIQDVVDRCAGAAAIP
ncbi:MAG: alpha/beta fold hydrolase [Anaerolineales bacterium]